MAERGTDRFECVSRLMVAVGVACMLLPMGWSWRAEILQRAEQDSVYTTDLSKSGERTKPRVTISKIGVDAVIVEETQDSDLDKGPMHLADSAEPGEPGNCCVAAHKEKWFRRLKELEVGDKVMIRSDGSEFTYIVTERKIVRADQASELDPTTTPTLTLITCTGPAYFGRGNGRLLVKASLVPDD